jgi:hypothetical protein
MYMMLDLLEKVQSELIKRHLLGCMLDLLENPKARSHAMEWRSPRNERKSIANLLIEMWNTEERKLGGKIAVLRIVLTTVPSAEPHGLLKNSDSPLIGDKMTPTHPRDTIDNSYAVLELAQNFRVCESLLRTIYARRPRSMQSFAKLALSTLTSTCRAKS